MDETEERNLERLINEWQKTKILLFTSQRNDNIKKKKKQRVNSEEDSVFGLATIIAHVSDAMPIDGRLHPIETVTDAMTSFIFHSQTSSLLTTSQSFDGPELGKSSAVGESSRTLASSTTTPSELGWI